MAPMIDIHAQAGKRAKDRCRGRDICLLVAPWRAVFWRPFLLDISNYPFFVFLFFFGAMR